MCNKAILKNGRMLESLTDQYRLKKCLLRLLEIILL